MSKGRLLLINPWIYDFAAFNLWVEPIGLLSIASILREHGYELDFIDCLDRYNPELLKLQGLSEPKGNAYGTGKYHRQPVEKPEVVKHISRYFCRYGITPDIFEAELDRRAKPDVVLVTSKMTYWYPGPRMRLSNGSRNGFPMCRSYLAAHTHRSATNTLWSTQGQTS